MPKQKEQIRALLPAFEAYVTRFYARKFKIPIDEIDVRISDNPIPRSAGGDSDSGRIPCNPLMHIDYISHDQAYARWSWKDPNWLSEVGLEGGQAPRDLPPREDLLDMLNLWVPTEEVPDYDLGFVPPEEYDPSTEIEVDLVTGVVSTVPFTNRRNKILSLHYKPHLTQGEALIFRSAPGPNAAERAILHGAFRSNSQPGLTRRSVEFRCMIFRRKTKKKEGG